MGRGRSDKTKAIVERAYGMLEAENPMTLRQLFYRLVSVQAIENSKADYQRLSRILTDAREREEIPYEWIVDRSRQDYIPFVFSDTAEYAEWMKHRYRRDYWDAQPWHVEIWTEKDASVGAIEPVTEDLGITIRTGRGFQSATRVHEIAMFFNKLLADGKQIEVLYLGDHDPSGQCIQEVLAGKVAHQMKRAPAVSEQDRRVAKSIGVPPEGVRDAGWLQTEAPDLADEVWDGRMDLEEAKQRLRNRLFQIRRVAIHLEDIRTFNLPPLRAKISDSRTAKFLVKHGPDCVELEALPPSELRRRLTEAIEERIDRPRWDRAVMVETAEIESITKIVGTIGKIVAGGDRSTGAGR